MLSVKQMTIVKPSVLRFYPEYVLGYCKSQKRLLSKIFNFSLDIDPKVEAMREKLIYCDYLDYRKVRLKKVVQKIEMQKKRLYDKFQKENEHVTNPSYSVLLKNAFNDQDQQFQEDDIESVNTKPVHMPYSRTDTLEVAKSTPINVQASDVKTKSNQLNQRYKDLYEKYLDVKRFSGSKISFVDYVESNEPSKVPECWMTDYEQFDDTLLSDPWYGKDGTPNPNSEVSHIPCGGCGALLHCKDPQLPGYLPSELFSGKSQDELKRTHCKRCHFLKFYNTALDVNVAAEEYPELLKVIKTKKCAVVLIIDLTDFPCSIWPDLKSVLHPLTPIFVVGNKIDLLPQDSPHFFTHVKNCLSKAVKDITQVRNVVHTHLISAKTGYGIEELINKLHKKWEYKGDVYLIGCTNVGKSSLFNILVRSDYCKVQAVNLIQRATISPWPGTTLNLLKFPILNPTDRKLYYRQQRLRTEQIYIQAHQKYLDEKFRTTKQIKYATLKSRVGMTFSAPSSSAQNSFSEVSHVINTGPPTMDETREEFKLSRWCYDTPGTIHRDQVLELLTTDELLLTLPREIIAPRSFVLKPGQTMFLAGLGRIDFLESHQNTQEGNGSRVGEENKENNEVTFEEGKGSRRDIQLEERTGTETLEERQTSKEVKLHSTNEEIKETESEKRQEENEEVETQEEVTYDEYIRCTLFANKDLPITICRVEDADEVYDKLLQTDAFVVPTNDPQRLKVWPRMGSQEMKMTGISYKESVADIVLSSAGWVAITPQEGQSITLRAWTPEARGLYLRSPALLRKSITLRGVKAPGTPLYKLGRQVMLQIRQKSDPDEKLAQRKFLVKQ